MRWTALQRIAFSDALRSRVYLYFEHQHAACHAIYGAKDTAIASAAKITEGDLDIIHFADLDLELLHGARS